MAKIKAVIVDFDDTLCMSEADCFALENETLRRMGRDAQSRDIHKKTWGNYSLEESMELRSPGIDLAEFWRTFPVVHTEFVEKGLIDVVTESSMQVLHQLKDMSLQVMVLTSRSEIESRHLLLPTHKISSVIDAFYHKDNTQWHKPDPRVFSHIEYEHGFKPNECVYVGDTVGDAAAAKGADLHFIASLESGLRSKSDFIDYAVDAFIETFTELPSVIAEL